MLERYLHTGEGEGREEERGRGGREEEKGGEEEGGYKLYSSKGGLLFM